MPMKKSNEIAAVRPMPKTFKLSVNAACPRAAECLRYVALSLATTTCSSSPSLTLYASPQ